MVHAKFRDLPCTLLLTRTQEWINSCYCNVYTTKITSSGIFRTRTTLRRIWLHHCHKIICAYI
uniref:Uncharacterized protein n=1 Tax=Arundo donax TaxID=35708 RepID=A0A0A9CX97_ARUDO